MAAATGSGAEAAAAARLDGAQGKEETAAAAAAAEDEEDGEDDGGRAGKATGAAAAAGGKAGGGESEEDEEEDGEDVFEVEKILDVKIEGGKTLYKVRWKGYTSDDDTWEPEAHLEDCKEVLLEFRKKIMDNKPKPVKKDIIQKPPLNDDIFEAESDSDLQSETKDDVSPKKKKKKSKEGEDKSSDDLKKKKSKSAKLKEKPRTECENSSDTLVLDSKPKKRTSETKEDSKDPKKQRKEDTKDIKKRKGEDLKVKPKEDSKENKKSQKEKHGDVQLDSSTVDDSISQGTDNENSNMNSENKDEEQKIISEEERLEQEIDEKDAITDKCLDGSTSNEDDGIDTRAKRKKKKIQKAEDCREEIGRVEIEDTHLEKKSMHKKQTGQEKVPGELEKVSPAPSPVQKGLKLSTDERVCKPMDSPGEEKEIKKTEIKEKSQKKEPEKEEKTRKEQKVIKNGKQQVLSLGMDMQLEWLTLEEFQKHLDGEDENHVSTEPISSALLRDAVKSGDYMTVKMALSSNEEYNLDQEDPSGMTLVMLAAAGGHDDLLRVLIRKGAKVNGRQKNGTTALIHAAEKNFLTTVAILLEAGAYVNMQQSSGETALMKACKRGNSDIVRLMIESGADCNILSKHQNSAMHFAKQCNNVLVYEQLKSHLDTLSRVAEDTIRNYFETRLVLLEPVFPIACHCLCEGPDFSLDFNYKPPQNVPEGSGILLFIFHSNFIGKDVVARLCGPCSVQAVVLNDKFQLPVFLDSHFIYSFSPTAGLNKLFIRLAEAPTAKVKLLIGAYRVQQQ
ncbi:M-phase phosphoprotein 8 [Passer montanus]|uniref:M-phase phosphoprotein 8 n=1 Tax=Passer montanus TaxID=9160 RepID=UPI001961F71D|nr:M-phase phosphoprotein 8 [Passer montanus]